ncbi:hypothetical protein [Pleurocapsa sp. PCC 7319]|uniref:hypothetical protein n=1 Tax=Pleurocapsa sp. PCC 7319 TaxID=118161 RepID=UPI0003478601|nr:hypothetical protein [Pleurocapsa sp. PCC 7319]
MQLNTIYLKLKSELFKFIDQNPFKSIWFIFTIIGISVFIIYYINIEYLPDLNIKDSIQLIFLASITSIFIVVVCLLLFIAPGILWSLTLFKKRSFKRLLYDTDKKKGKLIGLIIWLFTPTTFFYTLMLIANSEYWYIPLILLIINYFCLIYIYMFSYVQHNKYKRKLKIRKLRFLYFGYFFLISILNNLILLGSFSFIYKLSERYYLNDPVSNKIQAIVYLIMIFILVVLINIVSILKPKNINRFYWYLSLSTIIFLISILYYGELSFIPSRVMEIYKFGNIKAHSIILDKIGCSIAKNNIDMRGGYIEYKDKTYKINTDKETCVIPDVNILSRLGEESYLELKINLNKSEKKRIKFTIPSDSIISFSSD